jgi:hypothetical protein
MKSKTAIAALAAGFLLRPSGRHRRTFLPNKNQRSSMKLLLASVAAAAIVIAAPANADTYTLTATGIVSNSQGDASSAFGVSNINMMPFVSVYTFDTTLGTGIIPYTFGVDGQYIAGGQQLRSNVSNHERSVDH